MIFASATLGGCGRLMYDPLAAPGDDAGSGSSDAGALGARAPDASMRDARAREMDASAPPEVDGGTQDVRTEDADAIDARTEDADAIDAAPCEPRPERCDGIDDDCDVLIDEDLGTTACGLGACARSVEACAAGVASTCEPGAPSAERCNGLDDDCNAVIDDGLGTTTCGVGACSRTVSACSGGAAGVCEPGAPSAERCNGLDDDCDAVIDDGLGTTSCGVGACATTVQNCVDAVPRSCAPLPPSIETCNGLDDDCDGLVDDGLGTTTCGVGACANTVPACAAGVPQTCAPDPPRVETCNGLDDDCDGLTDDGLGTTTCGVGACVNTVQDCVAGVPQACAPKPPQVEVCNGVDDDCNGVVDDGAAVACSDGDACTLDDTCDSTGRCVATDRGLTDCGGMCVDLDADATNCGACGTVCGIDTSCVLGECRRWSPLGGAVNGLPDPEATAHALGSDGADAYVAWVGADGAAHLHRYGATGWTAVGASIVPPAGAFGAIDLAFVGAAPRVLWSDTSSPSLIHVSELVGGTWNEGARSAYAGPCYRPITLALALDGTTPHIISLGGGCAMGVAYAEWTGAAWWHTPMPPAVFAPGEITMNGAGGIDVAWTGRRALIAMMDSGVRSVRRWEAAPAPGAWVRIGSDLDVVGPAAAPSTETYLLSMATDAAGDPWVAFAEDVAGRRRIHVKRFDPALGDWVLVGGGAISDPANDADEPSLVIIGTSAYVAYVEQVGGVGHVLASRWNGRGWQRLGPAMNESLAQNAGRPYAASVGGAAAVAFCEPGRAWTSGRVHVRTLR
jgi:hypothetical protein